MHVLQWPTGSPGAHTVPCPDQCTARLQRLLVLVCVELQACEGALPAAPHAAICICMRPSACGGVVRRGMPQAASNERKGCGEVKEVGPLPPSPRLRHIGLGALRAKPCVAQQCSAVRIDCGSMVYDHAHA